MKYKQVIENNKGIYTFLPGYESCDGEQFDPNDSIHTMMEIIVPWLHKACDYFPHPLKYILDIGSGAGSLAFFWRKHFPSLEVFTLDGNPKTLDSPFIDKERHFVVRTDEEYKIVNENNEIVKFDLITSFEHLEHIQEKTFRQFLKNILNHSHEKTLFISTAADWEYKEEDKAHIHCNVKNAQEWKSYLNANKDLYGHAIAIPPPDLDTRLELQPSLIQLFYQTLALSTTEDRREDVLNWQHRIVASTILSMTYQQLGQGGCT
jgi:cyclopropane fatty-acyl-phospholipid synthase-like methyltransferase